VTYAAATSTLDANVAAASIRLSAEEVDAATSDAT
jgi:hypothetical protein